MNHRPCGTTTKDDKSHGMLFESWRIILVNCSGKLRGLGSGIRSPTLVASTNPPDGRTSRSAAEPKLTPTDRHKLRGPAITQVAYQLSRSQVGFD
jgi:hypothetical protein